MAVIKNKHHQPNNIQQEAVKLSKPNEPLQVIRLSDYKNVEEIEAGLKEVENHNSNGLVMSLGRAEPGELGLALLKMGARETENYYRGLRERIDIEGNGNYLGEIDPELRGFMISLMALVGSVANSSSLRDVTEFACFDKMEFESQMQKLLHNVR